jgi:hypothetical protein
MPEGVKMSEKCSEKEVCLEYLGWRGVDFWERNWSGKGGFGEYFWWNYVKYFP